MDIQLPHPFFAGLTCFQLVSWQFQLSWDVGWKTSRSFNTTGSTVSVHLRHEGSPTFPSRHRFPTVSNKKKVAQCTNFGWWDGTCCEKWKGKGGGNWDMGVSKNKGTPKSSIWIGCSIINHPFWGTPNFRKHPYSAGHLSRFWILGVMLPTNDLVV